MKNDRHKHYTPSNLLRLLIFLVRLLILPFYSENDRRAMCEEAAYAGIPLIMHKLGKNLVKFREEEQLQHWVMENQETVTDYMNTLPKNEISYKSLKLLLLAFRQPTKPK